MQTDNTLIQLFLPIIQSNLTADGYTNVVVQQANQPTQQGIPTAPTVYFYKIGNRRYGFLGRNDLWNSDSSEMMHHEKQYYETTFRIQTLVLQNVQTPTYTASDLANEVACIMQSDTTLATLNTQGVGILRVTDISNPYFTDDRDNFEALPSFDFTLLYLNDRLSTTPIIDTYQYGIYPV
jgi:hypothetical protein